MLDDPIVAEVRQIREQLAREFNFDVHAVFEDLRKKQLLARAKLVRRRQVKKPAVEPAPNSAPLHPGR